MWRGRSSLVLVLLVLLAAGPATAAPTAGQLPIPSAHLHLPDLGAKATEALPSAAALPKAPALPDLAGALARIEAAVGAALSATAEAVSTAATEAGILVATVLTGLQGFVAAIPPERRVAAARAAGGLAAAGAGTAVAGRLPTLGLPLYSRLDADELLSHDVRRAMVDHLRDHPGTHVSALADSLDLAWGTVVYHLDRLLEARILVARSHGSHKCLFVNGGEVPEAARQAIPVMKSERAREVVAFVHANPAASQKDVGSALGMSPGLVSWHVQRLADVGLLRKERRGRGTALFVREETATSALRATA